MTQNTRLWLHGLGAAFIGGGATSLSTVLVAPDRFNMTSLSGFEHLLTVAIVAGIVSAAGYLKQSPLPSLQIEQKTTEKADSTVTETTVKAGTLVALIAALFLGSISLAGCSDFERKTFQTLSASKAVIDQAQADYEAGKVPKTQASYDAINKAKDAQAAAVKAFQQYQTVKLIVKSGGDLPAQEQAVSQALAQLGPLVAAVKQLYTTKTAEVNSGTLTISGTVSASLAKVSERKVTGSTLIAAEMGGK
jgi:hypothetical protein